MKLLQWTSLWISVPACLSYWMGSPEDAFVLSLQFLGGFWHHTAYSQQSLYFDRFVTVVVAVRSLYISYASPVSLLIYSFSYGYIYTIYVYGKQQRRLAWDPDISVGNKYHGSMHIVCGITYVGQVWLVKNAALPAWCSAWGFAGVVAMMYYLNTFGVNYYTMMQVQNMNECLCGGGVKM